MIFRTKIVLAFLLLAATGCTVTRTLTPPSDRVFSLTHPVPEGISTSGVWVEAGCRVMRFSRVDFLGELGIRFHVSPAGADADAAKFALLTGEQVSQLEGKGRGAYIPVRDTAAFLLKRAAAPAAYSLPEFYMRTGGGRLLEVEISAEFRNRGDSLGVRIAAAESDPTKRAAPPKWVARINVPISAQYILVDLPMAHDHPSGTRERMMVLMAARYFMWKDGRQEIALPWGRVRITTIKGRTIRIIWRPVEKD